MSGLDKHTPNMPRALTRQQLFPTVAGMMMASAIAISLVGIREAAAQSKADKKTAKYRDHLNNGQSCSQCRFFLPPKSCQLVEVDISPTGWSSFFAKKT